jgi:hypothetical protein
MPGGTDENHYKSLSVYPISGREFTVTKQNFQQFCCCNLVYNISYLTVTILDIIYRPVFYLKLSSIGFSIPHRKHITSPLLAQQVNAIYRFVTMAY